MSDHPIPADALAVAAQQMLSTIHADRAKYAVQRVANGHSYAEPCGLVEAGYPLTYAERERQLQESEDRLRSEFGELLSQ